MNEWVFPAILAGAAMAMVIIGSVMLRKAKLTDAQRNVVSELTLGAVLVFAVFTGMALGAWKAGVPGMDRCEAEDGGPNLPCTWDLGTDENGLHRILVYADKG